MLFFLVPANMTRWLQPLAVHATVRFNLYVKHLFVLAPISAIGDVSNVSQTARLVIRVAHLICKGTAASQFSDRLVSGPIRSRCLGKSSEVVSSSSFLNLSTIVLRQM